MLSVKKELDKKAIVLPGVRGLRLLRINAPSASHIQPHARISKTTTIIMMTNCIIVAPCHPLGVALGPILDADSRQREIKIRQQHVQRRFRVF